jgi:hypothetical protein
MKKRYSILVRADGSDHEVELCQVSSNPEKIVEAAGMKRLRKSSMGRRYYTQKYNSVRVVDLTGMRQARRGASRDRR